MAISFEIPERIVQGLQMTEALAACRVGRNWRIPRADFLDMLATSQPFSLVPPNCETCETILAGDGHGRLPAGAADPDETIKK